MPFAVTVTFTLRSGEAAAFLPKMIDNAATSLANEPGCLQFDVATDDARPDDVFLYEVYTDPEAFDAHLASAHYISFDAATTPMIEGKRAVTYNEVR